MANLWIRSTFYLLEQTGLGTFALNSAPELDIQAIDILRVNPVNVAGGADLPGFGYLYSKVTLKQPGINQELYALQTVLQLQTLFNS